MAGGGRSLHRHIVGVGRVPCRSKPHPSRLVVSDRLLPGQVHQRQQAQLWGALLVGGWLLITVHAPAQQLLVLRGGIVLTGKQEECWLIVQGEPQPWLSPGGALWPRCGQSGAGNCSSCIYDASVASIQVRRPETRNSHLGSLIFCR